MKTMIVIALFALATVSGADSLRLRMPGLNCGGSTVGWKVTADPADKQTFILECANAPPATLPNPPNIPPVIPPSSWNETCPGFTKTWVVDLNWNAPGRVGPINIGKNDVIVARFTTGNLDSVSNNLPRVSGAEFSSGPPSARFAVLSAKPCDFANQARQGATSAGNSINIPFNVGATDDLTHYYPMLAKQTTYFVNIKNLSQDESCGAQGACGFMVELGKPSGV